MTRNDDIERVLQQWFTEGPRHMSDRLFDGTFERIERLPKRRLAGLGMRLPAMNLNIRLAAAAAVVVALVGYRPHRDAWRAELRQPTFAFARALTDRRPARHRRRAAVVVGCGR